MLRTTSGLGATLLLAVVILTMPEGAQSRGTAGGGVGLAAAGERAAHVRHLQAPRSGLRDPGGRRENAPSLGHKSAHQVRGRLLSRRHRLPPAAPFRGGPNGAVANGVLIRPGSPGRAAGCEGCAHADAGFIAWYGPVFWPYAFDDIFTYAFWPVDYAGYDGPFWTRAYTDTIDGAFGTVGNADVGMAAVPVHTEHLWPKAGFSGRSRAGVRGFKGQSREFARICGQRYPGVTSWPIERIRRMVREKNIQRQLAQLASAATEGATMLHAACRAEVPASPIDRIEGEQARLEAIVQAVAVVRPRVAAFWTTLSDDQRARFDWLGEGFAATTRGPDSASVVDGAGWSPTPVCLDGRAPADQKALAWIDGVVQPTGGQRRLLADLRDANARAAQALRSNCATALPRTPPERLNLLAQRLDAMLDAVDIERRALVSFYGSLTKAQQARLNGNACEAGCPGK